MSKKRTRTIRRELERTQNKLVRAREALAVLEDGGAAERPIAVESASQVEPHAKSMQCPACGDHYRVLDHEALHTATGTLRVVTALSPQCGKKRKIYFAIKPAMLN